MKKISQLAVLLLLAVTAQSQTIRYVNSSAGGANNGTTWVDAFLTLEAALVAAQPGDQIWVAQGTYKPAGTNGFVLASGVSLYGGFLSGASLPEHQNTTLYPVYLSGDINGDDVADNYTTNRTDNALHILRIVPGSSTERAVVNGFTFTNGQAALAAPAPAADREGAGIVVQAKATIKNCTFTQNKAENGSAVSASVAAASGLIIEDCVFNKNETDTRSSGIYAFNVNDMVVRNCAFTNNKSVRGAFYPRNCLNLLVENCLFDNNEHKTAGTGSCFFNFDSDYTMKNCTFTNNKAGSCAGVYNSNAAYNRTFRIKGCRFEGNVASGYGATSIQTFKGHLEVDSCIFKNNTAPSSAAAIYNADTTFFTVSNSLFEGHTGNYAAAVANYGFSASGSYINCTFTGNSAQNGGGACSNGFKSDAAYVNCIFQGNTAGFGGALFTQNDTTFLLVQDCLFSDNGAETNGGAIYKNVGVNVGVESSVFNANSAEQGGCIYAVGDSSIYVINSIFTDNLGLTQGPVVNLSNTTASMVNCLMARNLNISASGAGGTLINNASEGFSSAVSLTNCTIVDNIAPLGGGLAQWQDDTSSAVMVIQNCILSNIDGGNYAIEAGTPQLTSLGGNQSSDESMTADLTAPKDLHNTSNNFVDADNGDYHLAPGPGVDGGVAEGAPATDIEGVDRVGLPDVGAYEYGTTGTLQRDVRFAALNAAPNPATDFSVISLQDAWNGTGTLEVMDHSGKLLRAFAVEKNSENWQFRLPVNDLQAGTYHVQLTAKGHIFSTTLLKF